MIAVDHDRRRSATLDSRHNDSGHHVAARTASVVPLIDILPGLQVGEDVKPSSVLSHVGLAPVTPSNANWSASKSGRYGRNEFKQCVARKLCCGPRPCGGARIHRGKGISRDT